MAPSASQLQGGDRAERIGCPGPATQAHFTGAAVPVLYGVIFRRWETIDDYRSPQECRSRASQAMSAESLFRDKSVLVTGGTGSFGRRFVETLLRHHAPRRVIVFSRDEVKQDAMQQEFSGAPMRYFLGDVRDRDRLHQAFRDVDTVVHAAALKQVPAAEYNPMECVKTNVHGAENVISAALANDVHRVMALSTDKAANPVNLYGASKLVADKLFTAANNIAGGHRTVFSVTRYGNVLGSRGSVLPHFQRLVRNGAKELPITHVAMTRFWITLQQGVDFVMKCFERMQGGEIFVPRLPSMRVLDLAAAVAPDLPVREVGLRPGEKLHEVLCPADMAHLTYEFDDHFVIRPSIKFHNVDTDYSRNPVGERGRLVPEGFEYNSRINPRFLTVEELARLNAES